MGNSLPLPCVCQCQHEADGAAGVKKRSRPAPACRNVRAARLRHVVPVVDTPPEDGGGDGGEEERCGEGINKEAWRRPGCHVEPAGCGEDGGVRRVKIVMRRKDIAELVARLEQRDAAERNATMMEELNTSLGGDGNDGGRGGTVAMSPCRDAWRPKLSIIPEHY